MKRKLSILAGALIAFCSPIQTWAQESSAPITAQALAGPDVRWNDINKIQFENFQGESLGKFNGLALDLSSGRIVAVLVVFDQTLGMGGKTVAVPPRALFADFNHKLYKINMSAAVFKSAPAFDLSRWDDSVQSDKMTAAYRYFGLIPNFLATGEAAGREGVSGRPFEPLGYVDSMSNLVNIQVDNLKDERLGRVQSLVVDLPNGKILNVYVQVAPASGVDGVSYFSTIIPPTMFTYGANHRRLRLDLSKVQYAEQPQIVFQFGASGQVTGSAEQTATTPPTDVALVQGSNWSDVHTTSEIYLAIQVSKADTAERVEVGTINGRVTLRGPVDNQADKDRIAGIAVANVHLDNVDNQMVVTPQPQAAL
jgi:sporulation protein YlmC with PRC-barrel domain